MSDSDESTTDTSTHAAAITHTAIRFEGVTYRLPVGVVNIAIERVIEAAPDCGTDFTAIRIISVEDRCAEALAFLFAACRAQDEPTIQACIESEIARLGGGALGARECYANLLALHGWMGLFWGDFSSRFLCEQHKALSRIQDFVAARYQEEDTDDTTEPTPHTAPTHTAPVAPPAVSDGFARVFAEKPNRRTTKLEH
jgi:hypothetical protein